jgi:hypothetical protein
MASVLTLACGLRLVTGWTPWRTDIRDLISVEDVMEELGYGPNGGLVYCMECVAAALASIVCLSVLTEADGGRYLVQNLDWLQDLLGEYSDDDYFIFDCPGASLAGAACAASSVSRCGLGLPSLWVTQARSSCTRTCR